jgi:ABC-2 type transport system ATP-binding protein
MPEAVIEVQGLVKRYGDLVAVDHISFEVYRGEVFAFLGPNGAGKTTTVEILEGLRPLTSGAARVLGLRVDREGEVRRLRELIGVLPQDFAALDLLTVRENVRLFTSLYRKGDDPDELVSLVGLAEKADTRFKELSGGLKQRVGLAVALAGDPELLFLDEPTTGLDPGARRDTWAVIQGLKRKGKTVFLTTHYMEEAQALADRVGIIHRGRLVALGTPDELISLHAPVSHLVLKACPQAEAPLRRRFGDRVRVEDGDLMVAFTGLGEVAEALVLLGELGLRCDFEVRRASLEDVFLKLTGARLTEEGEAV